MMDRVAALISGVTPTQSTGGDRPADPDAGLVTRLYACADCEATFIGDDLADCPSCGADVEEIPTDSDLGFVAGD